MALPASRQSRKDILSIIIDRKNNYKRRIVGAGSPFHIRVVIISMLLGKATVIGNGFR